MELPGHSHSKSEYQRGGYIASSPPPHSIYAYSFLIFFPCIFKGGEREATVMDNTSGCW